MKTLKISCIFLILPLILGVIGLTEAQIPMSDALFYSFSMYFVAYEGPAYNYYVEAARWLAPIMTFSSVLMFFSYYRQRIYNYIKYQRNDSVVLYGNAELCSIIKQSLNNPIIETEALNWYKKANESGEDCKADIERINNLLNKKPENKSIDKTKVETKANSNKPIKAYEGDKPYIFVSYSHTDSKVVKEVLQMLINQGYRIWFDEGIRAGSSWTENLMNHIKNASHFIFFLSRHSINSKYCLKELRFADRRNKIIIPICIENVNVSDEIDFLLGEVQMLFKNNLEKEEFMEKFNSSNHIEICSR